MPNLQHDPQNPSDLLGRPIAAGDIVAWGTNYGHSAAIAVCKIARIRFTKSVNYKNKEVPQWQADDYQLYLQIIKSTGGTPRMKNKVTGKFEEDYVINRMVKEGATFWDEWEYTTNRVTLVKNVVKLDMTEQEARDAAVDPYRT